MRSSVSIALFFLLSAFFLFALLAALNRSRRSLAIATACLTGAACIIIFLTPVRLPSFFQFGQKDGYYRYVGGVTTTTAPDMSDPSDGVIGTTTTEAGR